VLRGIKIGALKMLFVCIFCISDEYSVDSFYQEQEQVFSVVQLEVIYVHGVNLLPV